MDDLFDSPFEVSADKWRLPDGESPQAETVKVLRSLGGFGEVTNKELMWLAYFLNENREARHSWPGEQLLQILVEMFDHRTPTKADRDLLCGDLAAIERECARVAAGCEVEDGVPPGSVRVEELPLPEANRTIEVYCEDGHTRFEVDLHRQSCMCPGWPTQRAKLRHGDVRRCCTHMVEAYHKLIEAGELTGVPPILRAVFEDRAKRGRSCDAASSWKYLKIKMRPYLVILRHHGWTYVYAPDEGSEFSRYAYDLREARWSYGHRPVSHGCIVDWIRQELSGPSGI